jgi:hypothetical protein
LASHRRISKFCDAVNGGDSFGRSNPTERHFFTKRFELHKGRSAVFDNEPASITTAGYNVFLQNPSSKKMMRTKGISASYIFHAERLLRSILNIVAALSHERSQFQNGWRAG